MNTPRRARWLALTLTGAITPGLLAQEAISDAGSDPLLELDTPAPSRDDDPPMPDVSREGDPVTPIREGGVAPVRPGLTGSEPWLERLDPGARSRARRLLAEGTFLARRKGRVVSGPGGRLIFVPDVSERRPGESPMLLAPCRTLQRLERALRDEPARNRFSITGEILVYHDRNLLLPTAFARAETESAPADPASPQTPRPEPSPALVNDPDVASLIEALSTGDRGTRALGNMPRIEDQSRNDDAARDGGSFSVRQEGGSIIRRRARLIRSASGAWTLTFDNGTQTGAGDDPLTVLPCRLLMAMERRAEIRGEDLDMIVSGRVFGYIDSGYILPTLYQVVPRDGINPLQ